MKLTANLIGRLEIKIDDIPITDQLSEKAKGLLCYILVENKTFYRETLASMFWADFERKSANRNLRHALWKIRSEVRKINDEKNIIVNINKNSVSLNENVVIKSDLHEFNEIISDNNQSNKKIQQFIKEFNGDFLENFYINDALHFNNWIYYKREEYKNDYFNYLYAIAKEGISKENFEQALEILNDLVLIDPYNENIYLLLLKTYMNLDNKGAAINVYNKYKRTLREELNISPGDKITNYFNKIINNEQRLSTVKKRKSSQFKKTNSKFNFYLAESEEDIKNFRDKFMGLNDIQKVELTKIPGRRLTYEGIFELLDELVHTLDLNNKKNRLNAIIDYRTKKINEFKLYYEISDYLNKNIHSSIEVIIYNLSYLDEKTIDFLSFIYRKSLNDHIKFHICCNINWKTNRINFFIDALKNQKDVQVNEMTSP